METDCSDLQEFEEEDLDPQATNRKSKRIVRKNSFVWKYYKPSETNNIYECIICGSCVGNLTSNLARHLYTSHNLTKQGYQSGEQEQERTLRGRPSRSFIWKYCTKEDVKHARCHLCNKLLYFGGGNTANIAKHLRRKHPEIINREERGNLSYMDEESEAINAIAADADIEDAEAMANCTDNIKIKDEICVALPRERRERKGSSYVWSYCDKLSRHTIRCKLCKKMMSFHGTANVITHLQRRHNIIGRVDYVATKQLINEDETSTLLEPLDDVNEISDRRRRRSAAGTSIVWKYCTRIGADVVRCSFCEKKLSFQGTSNLQRHLHRMHGIVTQGRVMNESDQLLHNEDDSFIWEYCSQNDEYDIKCSMCNFESRDTSEISKHLIITHAIQSQPTNKRQRRRKRVKLKEEESSDDDYDEFDNDDTDNVNGMDEKWTKQEEEEYSRDFNEPALKKDSSYFDEIIEEDQGEQCDEDLFDLNATQDYPMANPLSPQSSPGASPDRVQMALANSKRLRKLNEERVRMETEYFREKAGFYRMQKYLTALQAKKVRAELERFNSTELSGVAYTLNVDLPEDAIQTPHN